MGLGGVAGFGGSSVVCSAMLSTVPAVAPRRSDGAGEPVARNAQLCR